jgi:hypothetical protein
MTTLNKENLSPAAFIGVRGKDIISFGSGEPDLPPHRKKYTKYFPITQISNME